MPQRAETNQPSARSMAAKCVAPILSLVLIGCTATAEQAVPVARNVASNGLSLDVRPSRVGGDVLIYEVTNMGVSPSID